jgi:hypothetical protein
MLITILILTDDAKLKAENRRRGARTARNESVERIVHNPLSRAADTVLNLNHDIRITGPCNVVEGISVMKHNTLAASVKNRVQERDLLELATKAAVNLEGI